MLLCNDVDKELEQNIPNVSGLLGMYHSIGHFEEFEVELQVWQRKSDGVGSGSDIQWQQSLHKVGNL